MSLFARIASALTPVTASKELRRYERIILNAWRDTLPSNEKQILDEQLQGLKFVQRQAGDAKVVFYYASSRALKTFLNVKPGLHVATVVLRPYSGSPSQFLRVKIFVHRGRLFSMEFPKRPGRYLELHGMKMETLHVHTVEAHSSLA